MPEYIRPWLYPAQKRAIFDAPDVEGKPSRYAFIEASTKAGKAQPLDATVWTPEGPARMGDMRVGQRVLTPDGIAKVVGVHPQGQRRIMRITFKDGVTVEADEDHLWEVHRARTKPLVITTAELMTWPEAMLRRTWVPPVAPVQFDARDVPLDPYALGLLIGDGGTGGQRNSIMFSSNDPELVEALKVALPPGHELVKAAGHDWRVTCGRGAAQQREDGTHLKAILRQLDLQCGAHEKHIPAAYRHNSEAVRRAILQGILDTDGFVDKHGQPGLEQTSPQLAADVAELVQSLGGTVLTRVRERNGYRDKAGKYIPCRPVYRQVIRFRDARWCFRLERKASKVRPKVKPGFRVFESISFSRVAEAQCIEIDCPRHLYLTDGFTPTHNTSACIAWLFEQAIQGGEGDNYWWVAPVYAQAKIAFRRMKRGLPPKMYAANNQDMTLTLPNGAMVWFKSADNPDNLYGDDVMAIVVDEASRVKEEAWHACRSVLTATRGPFRAIGNVKGRKNWFYQLARKAEAGEPGMSWAKLTAWDAVAGGVLAKDEIEDARRLLPENVFKELYLAEASDDEGNPFGLSHINACTIDAMPFTKPVAIGADLAKKQDWTVAVGLDQKGYVCGFERWQKKSWGETTDILTKIIGFTPALIDSTGVGDPIVEQLAARCRRASGYTFTMQSKQKLMEGLALAIQSRKVFFPKGPITAELENFEYEYTRTGVKYCLAPNTPVLTDDLRWVPLETVKPGDTLLAFDEYPVSGKSRSWRKAVVQAAEKITRPCYRVVLEDGTDFIASEDHLWLVHTESDSRDRWIATKDLRGAPPNNSKRFVAHKLVQLTEMWNQPSCYSHGYMAGVLDGEGSLMQHPKPNGGYNFRLTFAQRENELAQRMRGHLTVGGFSFSEHVGKTGVISFGITGRRHEVLRLLGQTRPPRLLPKFDPDKLGTLERKAAVPVRSVEFIGDAEVVATKTSTSTFIAKGYATHNCAPEGFHDDCVMALGLAVEQLRLVSPAYLTSALPHSVPNPSPWLDNRVPNGEYYD